MAGKKDKEDNQKQHIYQNIGSEDTVVDEEEYRRLTGLDALNTATVQRSRRYLRDGRKEDVATTA